MDLVTLPSSLVLVVLLVGQARGQSLGCTQVDPSLPHTQDQPFKLEVDETQYSKNEPLQVYLRAIGSSTIKEFAIASYSVSGDQTVSAGAFVAETTEFQAQSCGATEDDLNMLRTPSEMEWPMWSVQGMWIPPADQPRGSYVVFHAAVRDSSGSLITGIRSPGVWRSDKDDEKTTISCKQVSPMDEVFPQPQQYRLLVSSMIYSPGSTIRVTLAQMPSRPERMFTKFMISAFDPYHERVESSFSANPLDAEVNVWCQGEANATVRQVDDDMKENVTVEWTPVHTPNMVTFVATVVDFGDDRRHTGIESPPVYVTWDNQTIKARNPPLDCSLATEENVNKTKVPYELTVLDYEGKTTDKLDSNSPLTVMLKSDATTVFTNYLVRAFDENGYTIGSFSASRESPSAISGTCGMEVGDMTIVRRMNRASWVWVPPAQYTGNVQFIVAVHNFFTQQHYVMSSGWIWGQSVSSSEITCSMATPHVETFPDSGSFKISARSTYTPGDELTVTLLSYDTYTAYIVRVFDHKLRPIGSLRPHEGSPSPSSGKDCEVQGDAIVNENEGMKKNATFWWKVPPDTPQSVMFVAAALHSSGRRYLGIRTRLNLTSDPAMLLPCPRPLPAGAGTSDRYEFTMMDLAGNRQDMYYDSNEPFFVHFSGKAGSLNNFLHARILASTSSQTTYGTFTQRHGSWEMRTGQCENANDTAVTYSSYPRFNVSTVWVAPSGGDQGVRFLALVMDEDGLTHEVYSPWFNKKSVQSPPVPVCRQVEPHVPVFPRQSRCELTAGIYGESGKFLVAQSYTKDADVQVYLRCPDDVSVTHYRLRAFDNSEYGSAKSVGAFRMNQGMLQGVPYNVTTCRTKDDSTKASQLVSSGFVGTWRPAGDYLPRQVRFYAAYTGSDGAYPRIFMGLKSQYLYLEQQTNTTTPNTTVPNTYFNVSCSDLTYDESGDRKYWLTVRNEKSAWRNASLYHVNSPLFVELMIPGRSYHAFRIGVRDELGASQGYFQSLIRYPGNWYSVRTEWCSQGQTAINDGRFYGRNITLMWTPGNQMYGVTFYAAVIDENSDLVQNIVSQRISPRLSSVGVTLECSETTPSTEPFRNWKAYGLKAWLSGIEKGMKKVEVQLAYYNGTFNGFMIRAFDQDDRPVGEFRDIILNGTRFEPYYCGQSDDTIQVKRSPSHLISAKVEFLAPAYVKLVRFVATISSYDLLTKGIVSDWVNVSKSVESLQGLGCNDVTPYMMTSPENPPFELVLQQIAHFSESSIQTVTLNLFNSDYSTGIKAYTIRAFSHGGSIGMFFSNTSDVSWRGTGYNATTKTCDLRNDTLTNTNDWPSRQNMSMLWEAPVGVAQVQFVATIINTDGDVFRGVKSKWINLAQTCSPTKCAQQNVQRMLCNSTSSWVNPTISDYGIYPNATEFGPGEVVTVKVASYVDGKTMHGIMIRAFSDEGRPIGRFVPQHVKTTPTSCQSPGDAVWNETDSMYASSAGSDWIAPLNMDHDVMYIYFVADVYNGQYWMHAKRSPRIYVRDDQASNGTRSSFYTWCNITSLYTPSNPSSYKIRVPDTFEDGRPIEVEIDSYMTKEMLGFMVRAYDLSGRSVGQFYDSPYSAIQPKLYSCHAMHDAFTNNTASMYIYSRAASWKNNGENVKAVTFVATVLSSDGTLHTGIRSETVHLEGEISTGPQEKLTCGNTSVLVTPPENPKFYLDANATEFTVQQPLYITLRTRGPRFSGFFVRAFCSEYQPCGIFSHSYVYSIYHGKAVKCASHQGDSITNSSMDFRFSQTVMWISPPSPPSMVIFVASVVDEHGRLTNSIRSDWIMRSGGTGVKTTPAPPHDVFCSDTEPHVRTEPPYPPFVIEAANGTYANTKTSRHIQIKSYGSTQIHWYFIRAFDRMGRSVGTFDSYTWSTDYGSSVNYVYGDLVTCEKPSDSIMSDLSASPRRSLVMRYTAPVRDTPEEVMFIAIIRDSTGMTYKAVQSKYISVDGTISGATTKASSVIMVTFLTLLTLFIRHRP